ncbi:hypothetical protein RHSIM_Rhsim11G0160200 [Rhododendron simsii]|uniref:Reticulon-like protein n=1 Tax=Rhododendron simsii TaxID=118357 RepID=A0A834G9Y9_RHOSS|nr:hypothetical protein RHSIM_Rhsim11G0160200 [Rhododendron simsii]
MLSGRPAAAADGDMLLVAVPEKQTLALPPRPPASGSNALVEYTPPVPNPEEEDLEVKLRRINEHVPLRVNNTSGSSAGSGSGDFHQFSSNPESLEGFEEECSDLRDKTVQAIGYIILKDMQHLPNCKVDISLKNFLGQYRQMRRKEQDRLARMDADYQKRQELAEFNKRKEERMKAAEERTAKNRLKRQKKKQRKKVKKSKLNAGGVEQHQTEAASDDDGDSDNNEEAEVPLPPLPDLEISEDFVLGAADVTRVWINCASSVAHDIAVGRNLKLFVQIAVVLWIISYIGGFFNFITLVYIGEFLYCLSWNDCTEAFQRVICFNVLICFDFSSGILLSLSVPVLYEKYQDLVDEKLIVAHKIIQTWYQNLDDNFLRKIPVPCNKEKKSK